jgi:cation:H+ antiporter
VTVAGLFLATGLAVVVAGVLLARAADEVAEATGLGRVWAGTLGLAAVTSLPELTTDVAAVRLGAPDLAVGDLMGSCMANMLILALLDLFGPRRRMLRDAAFDHALAGCLAIALVALAGVLLHVRPALTLLGVSPVAILLVAVYVAGSRAVHREAVRRAPGAHARARGAAALRGPLVRFALAAGALLVAGPLFASSAKGIAQLLGLGPTFVGTWLVAFATSLPELVSCIAALRLGAADLAIGNLFGSNAFNVAILLALDVAQPGTSIFAAVGPGHVVSALFAVALMGLGVAAIVYRAERRFWLVEPDSAAMLLLYVLGLAAVYAETVPR